VYLPHIFVGTLACGEAEFEECCRAIRNQQGVSVTHHVIADQPEFEAHNMLWDAWGEAKPQHDLMVKVDADTVLSRPTALAEIHALFSDPAVTGVQILLHDYFTDRLIAGLNAFSPVVKFRHASNRLFADHADSNHNVVLKGESVVHLAPIGWHCTQPHPRQAFHYGLHRALKKQLEVISRCAAVWLDQRDQPRSWALTGAIAAGWRLRSHFDYGNKRFEASFSRYTTDAMRIAAVEAFALSIVKSKSC
jgi:hypothetical protein